MTSDYHLGIVKSFQEILTGVFLCF